jgi:ABC-2 type transport system permease protein
VIRALNSEWIKLRTIRMNWVLVIIAIAFPVVVAALTALLANERDLDAETLLGVVTGTSVITAMLLGVVGASTITGEFGFGTIRVTFAATPRRGVVVAAKAIVTVVIAIVVEAVVVALAYGVAVALATARDADIVFAEVDAGLAPVLGVVLLAAIVALLGYGLGLLLRSTPVAVSILILWPLVAENIIGVLLIAAGIDDPFSWLPYNSGIQMANVGEVTSGPGRVGGGLYFFAVAAVITAFGAWSTNRRDA